jgi:poly-beta-1,6-N-acetyl-D-glucosamine biosynthesis protein PgaD
VEDTITVVCWGVYLYLLLPMFTLVLWIFGIQTIFDQIIGERGYEELIRLLENGGITTLVILLLISGWTYYNYLWFMRRGERRGNQVRISSDVEMSAMLETDITAMEEIRNARRLEIRVDGSKYRITAKD